jgi:ribosomal protein S18 acetylase RimI-like enzyme
MKKILLSLLLLGSLQVATAMEQPGQNNVADYIAKNAIVCRLQKAETSNDAAKNISQLLASDKQLSEAAGNGDFDQVIFEGAHYAFSKSLLPFFQLDQGIGQRFSQEYFKNIRDFNEKADSAALKKLLKDNWNMLVGAGSLDTEANIDNQIKLVINQNTTKVICSSENQVAGFITYACQRIFGECSIKFIAVDTQEQKNGFGRKLLEYAQYHAQTQKLKTIHLRVFQDNTSAINFYRTLGFMSINHNYHTPAFTMKKEI